MADTGEVEISGAIRNALRHVLVHVLGSQEFDEHIAAGSNKGDNYLGVVYRVTGKPSKGDAKNEKPSVSVILKVAPTNPARREAFSSHDIFLREILMYDEVLPMFRHFQESNRIVPEVNGFFEYPKCYKTIATAPDETLILEDLKADQFEMFDRTQSISVDHVRLIMKALGKYHALSFALRDQQPDKLRHYSKLEDNFMRKADENMKVYVESMLSKLFSSLNQEGDERLLEKVTELVKPGLLAITKECCTGELAEPYAVICHGDCWNNNILFKYDEKNKPVNVRLLDWQVSRYATPVTDLLFYLFSCTTKPLRDQYFDDIIRTYHGSLSEMIIRLGSDPAKLFPFEALQSQLRQFGKFGLATATLMLPIITMTPENIPDLDEMAESIKKGIKVDDIPFDSIETVYNKRMRDIVVDLDRLGYF